VLDELDDKEGLLICEIDLGRIEEVRKAMPVLLDRRPELYKLDMPDETLRLRSGQGREMNDGRC